MLLNLHVKNFALIDDADVSFGEGLNIFTGETGAGKSLLIDAIGAALGVKTSADMIRRGKDRAEIELVFGPVDPRTAEELAELDAAPDEEGMLVIVKTILAGRSLNRINDRSVTASKLREVTSKLVHIHGQHEHQELFRRSEHLRILDSWCAKESVPLKRRTADAYRAWTGRKEALAELDIDESARLRETDLLRYEIGEIEAAALRPGEEEALAAEHKKMQNARRIMESLGAVREAFGSEGYDNASDRIGKAARALAQAAEYDPRIAGMHETAETIESLAGDLLGEVNTYLDDLSFSGEDQARVEERLDLIRNIEAKYGRGYEEVMAALESRTERLAVLEDLDRRKALLEKELADAERVLKEASEQLSALRAREAGKLAEEIRGHLEDLNFLQVRFSVELSRTEGYTANGIDEAEFYISTNPGEDLQPLAKVASGGELSRVMLAVKTVLADADDIGTLIFDEIDAGISGRTAQKVSEKLALIAKSRQVICITHLAQIAAMADRHFRIEKRSGEDKTSTYISALGERETVEELARILGGVAVTEAVMDNAREMKQLALELKLQRHS